MRQTRSSWRPFAGLAALFLAGLTATGAGAQDAGQVSPGNQRWAAYISTRAKLTPAQSAALQAYLETSAKASSIPALNQDQIRAMSLVEWSDYWAGHMAEELASLKADAQAMRHFYALLSPQQKSTFDDATRRKPMRGSVAGDVISTPTPDAPDYSLPAFTSPDWLIKPTAENIARVYPSAALTRHIKGRATIHCTTDEDGYLKDCEVLGETPGGLGFGNAALEITAYMRFQPATRYGVPMASEVSVPIRFEAEDF
jgi:TonB family protein